MQNKPTITSISATEFHITGSIDFDNVTTVLQESCEIIDRSTSEIKFNLAGIEHSNSAGLALLTSLMRHAQETNKKLLFLQLPAKLFAAAKISDLDSILPCKPMTSAV